MEDEATRTKHELRKLCLINFHKWVYIPKMTYGNPKRTRICKRCSTEQEMVNHNRKIWR
jgi:hypothetical protein